MDQYYLNCTRQAIAARRRFSVMLFFILTPLVQRSGIEKVRRNVKSRDSNCVSAVCELKPYSSPSTVQLHWNSNKQIRRIPVRSSSAEDSASQPPVQKQTEKKTERYRGTVGEFGRFARIVATALLVFLLLFFVDIIAGLAALTVGSFYAIAVLFGVRGVETWGPKARSFVVFVVQKASQQVKSAYRAVRQEVRKRLED